MLGTLIGLVGGLGVLGAGATWLFGLPAMLGFASAALNFFSTPLGRVCAVGLVCFGCFIAGDNYGTNRKQAEWDAAKARAIAAIKDHDLEAAKATNANQASVITSLGDLAEKQKERLDAYKKYVADKCPASDADLEWLR